MDERAAALEARIATLEKQNAVFEVRMASMQGDSTETATLLKQLITEIHAIREKIAFGNGAWWMGVVLLGAFGTIAGGVGALVHRFTSGGQ
jgi:hypothetical protein